MKSLKYLVLLILITVGTNDILHAQEFEVPPPPPPPESFYEEIAKNESEYLKNLSAQVRTNLEYIKSVNKQKYLEMLSKAHFNNYDFPMFTGYGKKRGQLAKQEMELNIVVETLALKYKNAADNQKEKMRAELEDTLGKLFDLKEKLRQEELEILEKKIENLRKTVEVRKKNKAEIIRRRVMDLLQEKDYFKWD